MNNKEPVKKAPKLDNAKRYYLIIPICADDEVSIRRNLELLKEETMKLKPSHQVIKTLMQRTFNERRSSILGTEYENVQTIMEDFPMLKRSTYVRHRYFVIYCLHICIYTVIGQARV